MIVGSGMGWRYVLLGAKSISTAASASAAVVWHAGTGLLHECSILSHQLTVLKHPVTHVIRSLHSGPAPALWHSLAGCRPQQRRSRAGAGCHQPAIQPRPGHQEALRQADLHPTARGTCQGAHVQGGQQLCAGCHSAGLVIPWQRTRYQWRGGCPPVHPAASA